LVIPFDTAQITSNVNRTRAEPGLPASTLNGSGQMHVAVFGGNNTSGERSSNASLTAHPTGRYDFETENLVCGAQSATHGGADDNSAQAGHLVAATLNSGGNNGGFRTEPGEHLVVGALSAHSKVHGHAMTTQQAAESGHIVYAFGSHAGAADADASNRLHDGGGPVGLGVSENCAYALRAGRTQSIASQFSVRRLTPTECERLQGFPDDYTAWGIDEQGRRVEMSDSARYRMLGNAVCRAVSDWLDRRIVAVYGAAGG
jgi:DNA (cytosine-5)-methyltransferase 1